MSRKHFERLAVMIRRHQESDPTDIQIRAIALDLADICALENSYFDRARFLSACGLESA